MISRGGKRKGGGGRQSHYRGGNHYKGAKNTHITGGGDGCYKCGGRGHYVRHCEVGVGRGQQGGRGVKAGLLSNRDSERRFFDKVTKDSQATIDSSQEATRLLKAALTGASALLHRLADRDLNGGGALKS